MLFRLNQVYAAHYYAGRYVCRDILRNCQTQSAAKNADICATEKSSDPDMFLSDITNPFQKKDRECIICKYSIPLDYKNSKLLSQFISPYTGFIYDKHITGLCDAQQKRLVRAVERSRASGYMPHHLKLPKYIKDPKLFDPFSPSRPNKH